LGGYGGDKNEGNFCLRLAVSAGGEANGDRKDCEVARKREVIFSFFSSEKIA
jgi:hypothetical protein